jgi:hypothetical protein
MTRDAEDTARTAKYRVVLEIEARPLTMEEKSIEGMEHEEIGGPPAPEWLARRISAMLESSASDEWIFAGSDILYRIATAQTISAEVARESA